MLELEKLAKERLLLPRKHRHVDCGLSPRKNSTQGDKQHLKQVVKPGIAGPRIFQILKARLKTFHPSLHQWHHRAPR